MHTNHADFLCTSLLQVSKAADPCSERPVRADFVVGGGPRYRYTSLCELRPHGRRPRSLRGWDAPPPSHHHIHPSHCPSCTVTRERRLIRAYVHPKARRG